MQQLQYTCLSCSAAFAADAKLWRCENCCGPLRLSNPLPFNADEIRDDHSLWRYRAMLPVEPETPIVSMGEGMTPLVNAMFGEGRVHFKLEYVAPTGSFKDRGTTILVTKLAEWGVEKVGDDSSGNAGSSLAAYCARAAIEAEIFIPAAASNAKKVQIGIYGATLRQIDGPRHKASEAIKKHVLNGKLVYASHAWSPLVYEGTKTVAYEIWEQLGRQAPDYFVCPVGQGSLFLGAYRGFEDILKAGLIRKMPCMVGVQSDRCDPIVAAIHGGRPRTPKPQETPVSEGIQIKDPHHKTEILRVIDETEGDAIRVSDHETMEARKALAEIGFYAEPTSAVVGAALRKLELKGVVVAALTGSGLKSALLTTGRA